MRYAIYFTWNDNTEDTIIVSDKFDRDLSIKEMLRRHEFKKISYCKIYKSGEYGKHITVLEPENIKALESYIKRAGR